MSTRTVSHRGLAVEIRSDASFFTVYKGAVPVGTISRRRVYQPGHAFQACLSNVVTHDGRLRDLGGFDLVTAALRSIHRALDEENAWDREMLTY